MNPNNISEKKLQAYVVGIAQRYGWMIYHTYDSRRSNPGWPDLVLCRPPRLAIIELKTDVGRISKDQMNWLIQLNQCPGVEVAVIRPSDMVAIPGHLGMRNVPFELKLP